MYDNEEKKLKQWSDSITNIPVPEEKLEQLIRQSIRPKRRPVRKMIFSLAVVAVLLFAFVTTVRVSPAFASQIASIPGMERIVALIQHDKGLLDIVEEEYLIPIDQSQHQNGVTLTLEYAVRDEQGMIFFPTITTNEPFSQIEILNEEIVEFTGKHMSSTGGATYEPGVIYSYYSEYIFEEEVKDEELTYKSEIQVDNKVVQFEMEFTVPYEKIEPIVYQLNQTVEAEGQLFTISDVEVHPIRTIVTLEESTENTKKLLHSKNITIANEKGEEWVPTTNGFTSSGGESEMIHHFYVQSNFFREAESIEMSLGRMMMLDKDELEVIVDLDQEKFLKIPDDNRLSIRDVSQKKLEFSMKHTQEEFAYIGIVDDIRDEEGNPIDAPIQSVSYNEEEQVGEYGIEFEKPVSGIVHMTIDSYPQWVEDNQKIKLK